MQPATIPAALPAADEADYALADPPLKPLQRPADELLVVVVATNAVLYGTGEALKVGLRHLALA